MTDHVHAFVETFEWSVPAVVSVEGNYVCECGAVTHSSAAGAPICVICTPAAPAQDPQPSEAE